MPSRQTPFIPALIAAAFLLAPLPVLAQDAPDDSVAQAQDVEMPREVRVLVQRGLAVLGFDPGPADGLFGPKTRAAIWDWQAAKELDTTGYLTLIEAETLAAVGAEASKTLDMEVDAPAAREPGGTAAETATASSKSRNAVLYFPTCGTDDARPEGCWLALAAPEGCVLWVIGHFDDPPTPEAEWSGACDDTWRASGWGTLKQSAHDGLTWNDSGELVEGKRHGHWVERFRRNRGDAGEPRGMDSEGSYMDGKRHGHWIQRFLSTGSVWEGPYVDGKEHGRWLKSWADGTTKVEEYRHGELAP